MKKNSILSLLVLVYFTIFNINLYSQQCEIVTKNIIFESSNSLTFDVYITNTGAQDITFSHSSLAWNYDPAFLNGGTPTFTMVDGYSEFSTNAQPPSALVTSPNILRTSSNLPGSNGTIPAGQSLRLQRFKFQTSSVSFSGSYFNLTWKNSVVPFTRIFTWDSGTSLPSEVTSPQFILAQPLLVENFEFTGLLTNNGWAVTSAGVNPLETTTGLSYTDYPGSGVGNAVGLDNNGEDDNRQFTTQTSGNIYFSFLTNVVSGTAGYFLHLGTGTSTFAARVFVRPSTTSGKVNFGLSNTSTGVFNGTATDYDISATYLVVVKYEVSTTGNVSLWVIPSGIPATEVAAGAPEITTSGTGQATISGIYLRQYSATQNIIVDGIRVATAWEDLFSLPSGPALSVLPAILSGFSYSVTAGGPSASQSYDLSGTNLSPAAGNITVTGSTNFEVSLNNASFSSGFNVPYSGGALPSTPIYVRLKAGLPGGTYNAELITNSGGGASTENVTCNGVVSTLEPTNHVTSFTGVLGVPAYYNMNLSWIDAAGGILPDGYLIRGSSFNFDSIKVPIDGTPIANSFLNYNVNQGVQLQVASGLSAGTTYYFKIFPYSNSGTNINYKTDGSIPQFSLITANAPALPLIENFEYAAGSLLTSNGWIAHSGGGTNPITVKDTTLTYPEYLNSGLGKSVTLTTLGGEDVNRAIDTVSSGSVYAFFMVNVATAKTTGDYFFHLGTENSNFFYARVYVRKALNGNLSFGLSKSSTNTSIQPSYSDSIYSEGTTYLVAVKYTFIADTSNDEVKLWINPILNGTEPVANLTVTSAQTDATTLGMFALRQGGSTSTPALTLGGIRIAETWISGSAPSTFPLTVSINNGWNMVSTPGLHPVNQNVTTWWSGKDPSAGVFRFSGGYIPVTTTAPGQGYWMKNLGANTYNTGDEWPAGGIQIVTHNPIPATTGWNLFGGYETSVATSGLTTTPAGLITGSVFQYSSGYTVANSLVPGYGYWVKLTGAGSINIPTSLAKGLAKTTEVNTSEWGKIIITDAADKSYTLYTVKGEVNLNDYELPPAPPTGMFDVRFGSGRYAEALSTANQTIELNSLEYPVKVRVENADIRLQDQAGSGLNERLKAGEEVIISNSSVNKLMVTGEVIPDKYALEQNYPNPFNPSTKIEFSIPEDVNNVTLTIYNALGQRVAELVNSKMEAGKYSYVWNAGNVATGLYIYELRTDKFVSVKKMMLLK